MEDEDKNIFFVICWFVIGYYGLDRFVVLFVWKFLILFEIILVKIGLCWYFLDMWIWKMFRKRCEYYGIKIMWLDLLERKLFVLLMDEVKVIFVDLLVEVCK